MMLTLIHRILTSKSKDMFTAQLATTLLLAQFGVVGVAAAILAPFIRGVVGLLVDQGILAIDLTLDSYREGQKLEEFRKTATEAYEKAMLKRYTEKEKEQIRRQYLAIISKIGTVGTGPK